MLQNEYFIAKIGVGTAENEPWKEWCVVIYRVMARCVMQRCVMHLQRQESSFWPPDKEWIEILKFWIQFFTNFRNFTDFSSKFCKISGIFNEFRHFGTCSRNPDKISSKFRWEIAFFMKKSEISIEISIFNLAKLWLIFLWNFEVWAVQRYANLVDLEKCWKMRLLSLS